MYNIKFGFISFILLLIADVSKSQGNVGLLDSILNIYQQPKGITVYPIDFQKAKVSEELLIELNEAHYEGIAKSGIVEPKTQMSKKYVKKNLNDITFSEILGHNPQNLISVLKIIYLEQNGDNESDYYPLKSMELIARHTIYDIATGKQLYMNVLQIKPNIGNIKIRKDQNIELCKILTEQIKQGIQLRFPALSILKSINTVEKDKALFVDVDNTYSIKTNKKDLYVNIIKNVFYNDNKPLYQFETIGKVDFDKNIDIKISNYKVKKGKEEINAAQNNNQILVLSTRPLE